MRESLPYPMPQNEDTEAKKLENWRKYLSDLENLLAEHQKKLQDIRSSQADINNGTAETKSLAESPEVVRSVLEGSQEIERLIEDEIKEIESRIIFATDRIEYLNQSNNI